MRSKTFKPMKTAIKCPWEFEDCYAAYKDSNYVIRCMLLSSANFKCGYCPFYKTDAQYNRDRHRYLLYEIKYLLTCFIRSGTRKPINITIWPPAQKGRLQYEEVERNRAGNNESSRPAAGPRAAE